MCMADDADGAEFLHAQHRRARKAHRCGECGRTIRPGERYEHVTAKWDGRMANVNTCAHCQVARSWLGEMCGPGRWVYEGVLLDLGNHVDEGHAADPWLRAYVAGMERRWAWPDGTPMPTPPTCPPQARLLQLVQWTAKERPWVP